MNALGPKSPRLQRLRRLSSDRRARREAGAFVVEGPHLVAEAAAAGLLVEAYVEEGRGAEAPAGVETFAVAPGALAKATDATTSQGIAGVARLAPLDLDDVPPGAPVLVLVALADPGNVGTLLRSAEAAGFGAVLCTAGSVDPWSPKCVRASAGSVLRMGVGDGGEGSTVLRTLAAGGRHRVGTTAADPRAVPYDRAELPADVALVLGNEAHGLPAALAGEVDGWVTIPMAGGPESLNVAMAGTLLCFEVARRGRG